MPTRCSFCNRGDLNSMDTLTCPDCAAQIRDLRGISGAAYRSYEKHFADPLDAAEKDLLGRAVQLLQLHHSGCPNLPGSDLYAATEELLAKVKP